MSCNLQLHVISSSGECYIYIIVTDMEGNIRIYRLPKGRGTDQWKWYCPSWRQGQYHFHWSVPHDPRAVCLSWYCTPYQ